MKTSVFIQSRSVQALCGDYKKGELALSDWLTLPIADDAVVGGVIVNDGPVRAALSQLQERLGNAMREVCLVVDSNSIFTRRMSVPLLPPKKLEKLVESEFSDIENRGELLFDYMVLKPRGAGGNTGEILASAVEKQFIESYVSLFSDAGIKVKSIDLAIASLIRFSQTEAIKGRTCIVVLLDGSAVSLALFVDGEYRMFNHNRLFQERGTVESTAEITQLISSMLQFNQAEKTGREVSAVYFGGLVEAERRTTLGGDGLATVSLCERIRASLGVAASEFPSCTEIKAESKGKRRPFPVADFICSCGNLLAQ